MTWMPENICKIASKKRPRALSPPIEAAVRHREAYQDFIFHAGENARIMRTPLSTPEDRIFQGCISRAHEQRRRPIMFGKYLNKVTSSSLLLLYYGKVTSI